MPSLYKVAIVGRVNVGKSTLFNRLISNDKAITSHVAGTTRDRNYARCSWQDLDFSLIDTGGLERQSNDDIDRQIIEQAQIAIKEADLLIFVVDVKTGIMSTDTKLAKDFKKAKKPIILAVNKTDNNSARQYLSDFYKLNLGTPYPISAINGVGTGDLLDEVVGKLKTIKNKKRIKEAAAEEKMIRVAIVGKPNVGKSSIVNAILGQERVIVSPVAHTTRDSQDIEFDFGGQKMILVDTAGMRRQSKKTIDPFEKQSIEQSIQSIKKSDIAILVTDAFSKLTWQDKHLIEEARKSGAGLIILANKWDLIPDKTTDTAKKFENYYKNFFPFITWAPIIFSSATKKMRIQKILESIVAIYQEKHKYINDNALDKLLKSMVKKHKPSRGKGTKYPYIYHLKQLRTNPPVFAIKIDFKSDIHHSYLRFIENNLRYKFGFVGTPIHIRVIKTQNIKDK